MSNHWSGVHFGRQKLAQANRFLLPLLCTVSLRSSAHFTPRQSALHLVNMSEKDFLRKKNKWLPKLKAWIDEHRPGEMQPR